jgi:hypothetical protein
MPLADCLQESNLENELVDAALRKDFSHTSRTQRTLATNTLWHFSRQFISYLFSITLILLLTLSLIARNPNLSAFCGSCPFRSSTDHLALQTRIS